MSAAAARTVGKGKAARRNAAKNADHVLEYLDILESAATLVVLETFMERNSIQLARVTRTSGAGRLKVTLQSGDTDVDVSIAGSLRFHGRAATKGDRTNCMCVHDLVVLHGPQAAGKIPRDLFGRIQAAFDRLCVSYPKGFFTKGTTETGTATSELGFDWETDEAGATAALIRDTKSKEEEDAEIDISAI
jgi:hypothetical protein